MYVCVCKAVTDGQIRAAINNGLCTRRQLLQCFGVGRDCGRCNRQLRELLKDTLQILAQPSANAETLCQQ